MRVAGRVGHHCEVDVVELAEAQEFRLAGKELQLALLPELVAVLDLDVLLRRHGDEGDAAAEGVEDAGRLKTHANAEHHSDLRVVPAGVGRARGGVGVGVSGHEQRIELTHDADGGAGARAAFELALDAGDGDAGAALHSHLAHDAVDDGGRLLLAEAGLRVLEDGLGYANELLAAAVDLLGDAALQVFTGRHGGTPSVVNALMLWRAGRAVKGKPINRQLGLHFATLGRTSETFPGGSTIGS